jgi:hypothetical protein
VENRAEPSQTHPRRESPESGHSRIDWTKLPLTLWRPTSWTEIRLGRSPVRPDSPRDRLSRFRPRRHRAGPERDQWPRRILRKPRPSLTASTSRRMAFEAALRSDVTSNRAGPSRLDAVGVGGSSREKTAGRAALPRSDRGSGGLHVHPPQLVPIRVRLHSRGPRLSAGTSCHPQGAVPSR